MIKAIIIDDEPYACQALATLLERHCPEVALAAICQDPRQAPALAAEIKPQLIFLDVEMPHMNGFELLEKLDTTSCDIIFTTSYDQYAIKAIRFSALDYLLKPVDVEELKSAVKRSGNRSMSALPQQLDILLTRLQQPVAASKHIALPTMEGLQIVPVHTIVYCSSNSNYTILTLQDKQKLTISRTLKEVEEMLEEHRFLRVHHSHLVNLDEVKKYIRGEGGSLLMSDGAHIDVSRSKKEILLKKLVPGK
jgi:two-component system LytT family response regulator